MSQSCPTNGRFPTEPAAMIITLTTLYLLLNLLSEHQLAALGLAVGLLPLVIPYLPKGGR